MSTPCLSISGPSGSIIDHLCPKHGVNLKKKLKFLENRAWKDTKKSEGKPKSSIVSEKGR